MSKTAWELVFMMVVLKLPIAYLVAVVWWAVRAQPEPYAPVVTAAPAVEPKPCPWHRGRRTPRGRGPRPRPSLRIGVTR
jgi:hypothetical protein